MTWSCMIAWYMAKLCVFSNWLWRNQTLKEPVMSHFRHLLHHNYDTKITSNRFTSSPQSKFLNTTMEWNSMHFLFFFSKIYFIFQFATKATNRSSWLFLGLEGIYNLTRNGACRLRVDLWDYGCVHTFAEYRLVQEISQ